MLKSFSRNCSTMLYYPESTSGLAASGFEPFLCNKNECVEGCTIGLKGAALIPKITHFLIADMEFPLKNPRNSKT